MVWDPMKLGGVGLDDLLDVVAEAIAIEAGGRAAPQGENVRLSERLELDPIVRSHLERGVDQGVIVGRHEAAAAVAVEPGCDAPASGGVDHDASGLGR